MSWWASILISVGTTLLKSYVKAKLNKPKPTLHEVRQVSSDMFSVYNLLMTEIDTVATKDTDKIA